MMSRLEELFCSVVDYRKFALNKKDADRTLDIPIRSASFYMASHNGFRL
jgi:hypothetical protein